MNGKYYFYQDDGSYYVDGALVEYTYEEPMTAGEYDGEDGYTAGDDEPYYESCMFSISGYYCMDTNGEYIGAPEYNPTTGDSYTGDEGYGDYLTAGGDDYTTGGDYLVDAYDYLDAAYDYFSDTFDDFSYSGFEFRRQLQDIGETGPDGYYGIDCYRDYDGIEYYYNDCYGDNSDSGWVYTEEYLTGGDWYDWYYETYGGYGDYYDWYYSTYYYDYYGYGYGDYGDYDFFEPDFYSEEGDGLPRTAHIEWNLNYYENEEEETGRRGEETTMDGLDLSNLGIPLPDDFRLPEINEYY